MPRGFFCLHVFRRGPVNVAVIQTEVFMPPSQISDTVLGDLIVDHKLDEKHVCYLANLNLCDRSAQIFIYSNPDTGEVATAINFTRSIVEQFAQHTITLHNYLENDFLPRFRRNSESDCSVDDLVAELELHTITVHDSGNFSFGFNSCETLHDHCLIAYFAIDGHIEDCDLAG